MGAPLLVSEHARALFNQIPLPTNTNTIERLPMSLRIEYTCKIEKKNQHLIIHLKLINYNTTEQNCFTSF